MLIYLLSGFIGGKSELPLTQSVPKAQGIPALVVPTVSQPGLSIQTGLGLVWGCPLPLISSVSLPPTGATRDIGSALTRMCMRHRSIEAKLRQFTK